MTVGSSELVERFFGRVVDVDSHEMMPTKLWTAEFGEIAQEVAESYNQSHLAAPGNRNNQCLPDFEGDVTPITQETVWHTKGPLAPGSTDMTRRIEVLDVMGVSRQLMFPTDVGLYGAMLRGGFSGFVPKDPSIDPKEYSHRLFQAHNEWAIRAQRISDRILPVAIVTGESPQEVLTLAKGIVDRGIRGIWFLAGELLGGLSPAHSAHDPLWEYLAQRGVVVTVHVGDGAGFLGTTDWGGAPVFGGYKKTLELNLAPWHMATMHLAAQNYTTTMVLGGVFDRFPALRFGAIETGAYWIGPLAHQLDIIHAAGGIARSKELYKLPEPPSYYIRNNVRVAAFDWEPVGQYINMYRDQGIEDVICFASDYPHHEGGYEPLQRFAESLLPLGPQVAEKFFVSNGEFLLSG
jgi:predicted TIM-barrel fold metal-dependent hydrolase